MDARAAGGPARTAGRRVRASALAALAPVRASALAAITSLLALVLVSAVVPGGASARPGDGGRPWVMVDADGRAAPGDCDARAATFRHIQDAVDAARDGERISVCPGRYREAVRIDGRVRDLYLVSEDSFQAVIAPPGTSSRPAIDIADATSVEVRGFRLVLRGRPGPVRLGPLSIAGTQACSPAPVGIRVRDSTAVTIRGMRIQADPACGYRTGISVLRSSARLITDLVTDFLSRGVVVGTGADVSVEASDIRFLHARLAEALPGSSLDPAATGLLIAGANAARIRTVNVFSRVPARDDDLAPVLWIGIDIQDTPGVSIRGDTVVRRVGRYGIRVVGSDGIVVLNTLVERSYGDAYFLDRVRGGQLVGSDAERSLTGFRLGPDVRDVTLRQVRGIRDQLLDCIDQSTGDGTAGTANAWRRSEGRTSVPSGICTPPTE
jgi:hypothetical protein